MYWVSGSLTIVDPAISSSLSGVRRQACGASEPLRNALAATVASSDFGSPCSTRYRWIFMAKNWVVTIIPVSPYQRPSPLSSGRG